MMKKFYFHFFIWVLIVFLFSACSGADSAYQAATRKHTVKGYEDFIKNHKNSKLVQQATVKREVAWFREAQIKNNYDSYTDYLKEYPFGKYAKLAKTKQWERTPQKLQILRTMDLIIRMIENNAIHKFVETYFPPNAVKQLKKKKKYSAGIKALQNNEQLKEKIITMLRKARKTKPHFNSNKTKATFSLGIFAGKPRYVHFIKVGEKWYAAE